MVLLPLICVVGVDIVVISPDSVLFVTFQNKVKVVDGTLGVVTSIQDNDMAAWGCPAIQSKVSYTEITKVFPSVCVSRSHSWLKKSEHTCHQNNISLRVWVCDLHYMLG